MMRGNNYSVKWIIMRSTCRIFVVYLRRQETQKVNMSIELQLGKVNGSNEEVLQRDLFTYLEFIKRRCMLCKQLYCW
jgi:hypothetical protein